jgi:hypothetical protein
MHKCAISNISTKPGNAFETVYIKSKESNPAGSIIVMTGKKFPPPKMCVV